MSLNTSIQHDADALAQANFQAGTSQASCLSALMAASLTEKAIAISRAELNSDQAEAFDMILQASKSRRAELTALYNKSKDIEEQNTALHLIFKQQVTNSSEGHEQRQLQQSIELPLQILRVSLDGLKLLHHLTPDAAVAVSCDLESAMNLNLASISSLRTLLELTISYMNNPSITENVQNELRNSALQAEQLSNEIVDVARAKIF